ncbi:Gcn5-related n-acetyltransferase [Phytophthora cinnamomi]|uniref:Gcn5-related n-acetyltransferase n=1 Tax=Phytophthora cinnamomi TaxID=4785 RepID=UPI00355A7671|nr:Gcn5-related n-acetyltransferase [Phytophthora cinnamomi]
MIYKDRGCDELWFLIIDGKSPLETRISISRKVSSVGWSRVTSIRSTPMPELQANPKGNSPAVNEFDQPVGFAMQDWTPPPFPPHSTLVGRYCQLEPLSAARHARDFWDAQSDDPKGANWTYMLNGPFSSFKEFEEYCLGTEKSREPQIYAIVVDEHAVGMIAYMRIDPSHGVMEVGRIYYTSRLQRTCAAAEAMYLLAANAFRLGYRRYEWKCDSCNLPSRSAATRFGFTYEGLFRQAVVYKGRNRDTTWFSIIDGDWNGGLKQAYERWLEPSNFDESGQQKLKLSELTAPFVHAAS